MEPAAVEDPKLHQPRIGRDELFHAAQLLVTAAVVARYYNGEGARHEWGLALAGLFVQLGRRQGSPICGARGGVELVVTLRRIWNGEDETPRHQKLDEMNRVHAVARVGTDQVILREDPDGRAFFQSQTDLAFATASGT